MKSTQNLTEYQQAVYDGTKKIPKGFVMTYGDLTKMIGRGSARSMGQALKHNPFAPEVPCHRVVRSDLSLGGFAGHTSGPEIDRKRNLLRKEGVQFTSPGQIHPSCRFTPHG